jgi:hypothetical protein
MRTGGPNKTVEIDESKFGQRKYRGHPVEGKWVFGSIERESGQTFLVPVPDRTADTLIPIIVTRSNLAQRSFQIARVRTAILDLRVTCIALLTTASTSSILKPGPIRTPLSPRGSTLRLFSGRTTAGRTTRTI